MSDAFEDDIDEKTASKILKLETAKHNQKLENDRLKRKLAKYEREEGKTQDAADVIQRVMSTVPTTKVPTWRTPKASRGAHHAWAVQMLSDLHLGEVQLMEEVGGYNSFNSKIAEMRLQHTVKSSIKIFKQHLSGMKYDGLCIPIAGDVLTGEIHEELTKTNSETVTETIVKWVPKLAAAIQLYVDEFGDSTNGVFVPCVTGNHDRRGKKLEHKNAARDSYSWILYHWLADYFKDNPKVTFYIPNSLEARFNLYSTRFVLKHGYGMGGGGPAAAVGALASDRQRAAIRDNVIGNDFDWMLTGHLHQDAWVNGAVMCGCMKGLDTYAHSGQFKPEKPSQTAFIVTQKHGVGLRTPIFCEAPGEREFWT